VVFGDFGDAHFCPSKGADGQTPYVFSAPAGLHRIYASYTGSGIGDSTFAPADSPVVLFRVGEPIGGIQLSSAVSGGPSGDNQTTVMGGHFDYPLVAKVVDTHGQPVSGAAVQVTSFLWQNGGPAASFNGAFDTTIYTGSDGNAITPIPNANLQPGAFQAVMSVRLTTSGDIVASATVPFHLQNIAVTGKPNIVATISAKQDAAAGQRNWQLQFRNFGAAAYDVRLTSVSFTQTGGKVCTPSVVTPVPVPVVSLPTTTSSSATNIVVDVTGCDATSKFTVQLQTTANAGAWSGVTTIANQFR
jgi:hypothetical protein